jgi:hypothetical protein
VTFKPAMVPPARQSAAYGGRPKRVLVKVIGQ